MEITLGQHPGALTRDSGTIGKEGSPAMPFREYQGNGIRQSVNFRLAPDFVSHFRDLPARIQSVALKNYQLCEEDPAHPGLQFKLVGKRIGIYLVSAQFRGVLGLISFQEP